MIHFDIYLQLLQLYQIVIISSDTIQSPFVFQFLAFQNFWNIFKNSEDQNKQSQSVSTDYFFFINFFSWFFGCQHLLTHHQRQWESEQARQETISGSSGSIYAALAAAAFASCSLKQFSINSRFASCILMNISVPCSNTRVESSWEFHMRILNYQKLQGLKSGEQ